MTDADPQTDGDDDANPQIDGDDDADPQIDGDDGADPQTDGDDDATPEPKREIRDLHDFFVAWYAGERDSAARLDRTLASDFQMITPGGDVRERDAVVAGIEAADGQYADAEPPFEIDIENVQHREQAGDRHLYTYEEHQSGPDGETVRLSSVWFRERADAPRGVEWVHLHETWLDDGA